MEIKVTSKKERIEKILKTHFGANATDEKFMKPRLKIMLFYAEEGKNILGFLYAYDLNDGYFRKCIIDDVSTGKKFDKKCAEKLVNKLIAYCKKEKIEAIGVNVGRYEYPAKTELALYKKLGFEVNKNEVSATLILR
ncbi:MAG: GNAT family N-acetyltransferase [Nanoarchaeota archaeon]|nr:GNAT family N-acetyltransferase [Nanoarchaeota archaeon]MBU1501198.1 GNAT family N-acetyltransferase [Nanoarchaeota archaeon]MBU2458917.1 GNAT family N-acetyltransferase [Nanoarchaeota archaeon]